MFHPFIESSLYCSGDDLLQTEYVVTEFGIRKRGIPNREMGTGGDLEATGELGARCSHYV